MTLATPEAFRASYLRDVSSGGIFVRSQSPLPQGTRVVVQLSVGPQLAHLPGSVVRVEAKGFGVQFDALTPEQQAALDGLVESTAERPPTEATLATQLAEANGVIEAYEETLALLRESEMEAVQRAEVAEFERQVVADRLAETEAGLEQQRAETARLLGVLQASEKRLQALQEELARRASADQKRAKELHAARGVITRTTAEYQSLERDFEARLAAQEARDAEVRASLAAELNAVSAAISQQPAVEKLRDEVRELASQLDDERLKSMALQRALERFVAMGGTIPRPTDAPAARAPTRRTPPNALP